MIVFGHLKYQISYKQPSKEGSKCNQNKKIPCACICIPAKITYFNWPSLCNIYVKSDQSDITHCFHNVCGFQNRFTIDGTRRDNKSVKIYDCAFKLLGLLSRRIEMKKRRAREDETVRCEIGDEIDGDGMQEKTRKLSRGLSVGNVRDRRLIMS